MDSLRKQLVDSALSWEKAYCNAPAITSALSELDAACLVGMSSKEYCESVVGTTVVRKGFDFRFNDIRYQTKANRPSDKPGSKVTRVGKARNYDWDVLIWILYDSKYEIQEAWKWNVTDYKKEFDARKRLSPADYRKGTECQVTQQSVAQDNFSAALQL